MLANVTLVQWILGIVLVLSALGVILAKKPVNSSLWFLLTLLTLATYYLQLSAEFIGVMQVLVYAGAILVIFMFVIILFQDAHTRLAELEGDRPAPFLMISAFIFMLTMLFVGFQLLGLNVTNEPIPDTFGTVQSLGHALYIDFFFPFEAIIALFLIAVIGALYIAKNDKKRLR